MYPMGAPRSRIANGRIEHDSQARKGTLRPADSRWIVNRVRNSRFPGRCISCLRSVLNLKMDTPVWRCSHSRD
jgi:hypothetical protein